jgi:hypothetical protein
MLAMTLFDTVPACLAAEFQRHVRQLLNDRAPGTVDELGAGARWFVASTAGPHVTLRPALLQAFFHDAALIYDIGASGGDHVQAADAVRLAAGLLELRRQLETDLADFLTPADRQGRDESVAW